MTALRKALSFSLLATLAATSHAAVTSAFGTDAEGWRVVSYETDYALTPTDNGAATYVATGGNPGGYIFSTDPTVQNFYFAAPAKFLGNDLSAYGTNLTYDLANTGNDYNDAATVVLKGGGLTAVYKSATIPGTAFTAFSIPLTETGWTANVLGGAAVSQADFKTILSSLTALHIRGEYVDGAETASLDNVNLQVTPVPEPASFAALGLGALGLLRRRKA